MLVHRPSKPDGYGKMVPHPHRHRLRHTFTGVLKGSASTLSLTATARAAWPLAFADGLVGLLLAVVLRARYVAPTVVTNGNKPGEEV